MKRKEPTHFHLDLRDLLESSSSQLIVCFTNIDFTCCTYNALQFYPCGINERLLLGLLDNITPFTADSLPLLVAIPYTSTLPDLKLVHIRTGS